MRYVCLIKWNVWVVKNVVIRTSTQCKKYLLYQKPWTFQPEEQEATVWEHCWRESLLFWLDFCHSLVSLIIVMWYLLYRILAWCFTCVKTVHLWQKKVSKPSTSITTSLSSSSASFSSSLSWSAKESASLHHIASAAIFPAFFGVWPGGCIIKWSVVVFRKWLQFLLAFWS